MRWRLQALRGGALAAAVPWLACQAAPTTPMPPAHGGVCENLAHVFYLVARERDRGISRESQIAQVQQSVSAPFVTRPDTTLEGLLAVVDYVYAVENADADEIHRRVQQGCVVDDEGKAVLTFLEPL